MKRLLVQTQLSVIDSRHRFVLEQDSGWQMVMGRVREMLRINPELCIDVMGPDMDEGHEQCRSHPCDVNPDLWEEYGHEGQGRLGYVGRTVVPNALATRYDFGWLGTATALDLGMHVPAPSRRYDAVYVNDPMQLRNLRTLFAVVGGYQPRFFVHSHFIDLPSKPKFGGELWLGQCEAALKADFNLWQCESSMREFLGEMSRWYAEGLVDQVSLKSSPWDDGYSQAEITSPVVADNMRFSEAEWRAKTDGKAVLFFPNRVSRSSGDYTNSYRFLFEAVPALRQRRQDFVVVANPSKHYPREQLDRLCGPNGFVSLTDDGFNRDEYRFVASHSDVVVALYDNDAYGGTASRECIELGCVPLWLDLNEYSSLALEAGGGLDRLLLARPDFSDLVQKADALIGHHFVGQDKVERSDAGRMAVVRAVRAVVRRRCSYEATTPGAMQVMGLLP